MKRLFFFLLFYTCCSICTFSDSIAKENVTQDLSKSENISRGRLLLLETLSTNQTTKSNEIFLYLHNQVSDNTYAAFTDWETIVLACLTNNCEIAIKELLTIDSISKLETYNSLRIMPDENLLDKKLLQKLPNYDNVIFENIDRSHLSIEDMDFLKLVFIDFFDRNTNEEESVIQKEINEQCDLFLTAYPDSRYTHYVRNFIRIVYKPGDWGISMDFLVGYSFLNRGFNKYFDGGTSMGLGLGLHYKKAVFTVGGEFIFNKTNKDIHFTSSNIWNTGSSTIISSLETAIGYNVLDNKLIILTPFAGISGLNCSLSTADYEESNEEQNDYLSSFSYFAGVNLDFKLKALMDDQFNTIPIRIRLTYQHPTPKHIEMNGDIISIMVGLTLNYRGSKRDL